jgi:lipopolysaccharide transport system permease protein
VNVASRLGRLWWDSVSVPFGAAVQHAALLRMLLQREVVVRTSGTLLGQLWPLLQPAMQVIGFWFLFAVVYDMRTIRGPGFLQYLLLGMLPWLCLSEVLNRATNLFREFSVLYARSPFPLELLPLVILVIPGVVYTSVLVLTVTWLLGLVAALKALVVIPLLLLWLFPLLLLLAVTGLFTRDLTQGLPFVLMLLMYATPILYFPDMLPALVREYLWLNPFADLMMLIHAWVEGSALPTNSALRLFAIWLLLLPPCWLWFRRTLMHVRELL